MRRKRTVAVRAETVAIQVAMVRIDAQAGVLVAMKWAKIQPAPSTWPGTIAAQQIREVVGLIELGDGDCCAMPLPGSFRKWLWWWHQLRQTSAPVLAVGVVQRSERASRILVDRDLPIREHEVAETSCVRMPREGQPGRRVKGTGLDLPFWLTGSCDQLRAEYLQALCIR